jgi:diguanylate cyclase (GGDEF)-like protein
MGDRAIENLSSALNSVATDSCNIYRVGGDEFVTIMDNPSEEQPSDMITTVMKKVNDLAENEPYPFSVAAGYAIGKGKDILEVVKKADADMYRNKKLSKEKAK